MTIQSFLARFSQATPTAGQWKVKCPAHNDVKASLAVREGDDGNILIKCHAGCSVESVVAAMGVTMADLFPTRSARRPQRREVAAYDYNDESGVLGYQSVRYEPKDFRQRRPDGRANKAPARKHRSD